MRLRVVKGKLDPAFIDILEYLNELSSIESASLCKLMLLTARLCQLRF